MKMDTHGLVPGTYGGALYPCHRCGRVDGRHGEACRETTKAPELFGALTLPVESLDRKKYPITTGVLDYFPDAIIAIARVSYEGNEQHNPGEPVHWDRTKSMDQADTLMRHFLARGKLDVDGQRHTAKMAWRALALLQLEIEGETDS